MAVKNRLDGSRKRKAKIHIKPENRGLLHRKMGIAEGKKISSGALSEEKATAKRTHNTKLLKEVVFAQNFGGHNK